MVIIAGVTGVGQSDPSVAASVKEFLLAWESRQYAAAAALTTGQPTEVAASLRNTYNQLGAQDLLLGMGPISVHGNTAHAYFTASIDLGRGGPPWNYQGHFTLLRHGSGWLVEWSPAVIVPGLGTGDRLAVLTKVPRREPLLDTAGKSLILRSPVVEVGVVPGKVPDAVATATKLAKVTGLASEADQMVGQIQAAPPNSFLELIQLSPRTFRHLKAALGRVPHLMYRSVPKRLFRSAVPVITGQVGTEAAKQLIDEGVPYRPGTTVGLSGLQEAYQATLAGTPTTEVVVQNSSGHLVKVLKSWPGQNGSSVRTTINLAVQRAAQQAVTGTGFSAALVAVQARTGQILAVADHTASGMPGVDPLNGRYHPGQAFTIVPTAALLSKGGAFGSTYPVPCRQQPSLVGGQTFNNIPPVPSLGKPRFSVDFANACSTAFAELSMLLNRAELSTAASQFGIGVPWQLPLRPSPFIGSIQTPRSQGEKAADSIGIGTVLVSPLDMALAAGVVESGSWHRPSIVTGPSGPTLTSGDKLPVRFKNQVISRLQQLMAGTVQSGAAQAAQLSGERLYGQVGTAPLVGHHKLKTIWFVGFRGGVAFAVVALSRSTAFDPAVLVARNFIGRLPAHI